MTNARKVKVCSACGNTTFDVVGFSAHGFQFDAKEPSRYYGGDVSSTGIDFHRGAFIQRMVTQFADRVEKTAPPDGDMTWKY